MPTYQTAAFDALGDASRRSIFELLGTGPRSVAQIAEAVPISRPAVSQHLKVLKESGLVTSQAAGTRRIYRIDAEGVRAVRDYFDHFWTDALASFARVADTLEDEHDH